jgi:predicted cupin superfamily sugar epimerase
MDPRARQLIESLRLAPHPEGGAFREVFRAKSAVSASGGGARPAATHIYFLLVAGEHSRWHRVAYDEVWHVYEGAPLELTWIALDWSRIERRAVGAVGPGREPSTAVPAGCWQTARSSGAYSLAGCTVAPGFDFADFALLSDDPEASDVLRRRFPEFARFLLPARP